MSRTKQQCRGCYGQLTHDLGIYPCATVAAVLPLAEQIATALKVAD